MIYIDNSATTKVDAEVIEAMLPYLSQYYGNPGSKYYEVSVSAKKAVEEAREKVARLINAEPEEIIFTSSGAEANNFIIKGVADYLKNYEEKGNHLMTSKVEHKSVLNPFKYLNGELFMNKEISDKLDPDVKIIDRGYDLDILEVNAYGQVEFASIVEKIREETILGSFMWANNETGNLNDIDRIAAEFNSRGIYIHSDATQTVGKLAIDVKKTGLDGMTFSGHKLYGPKGVGAAYLRKDGLGGQRLTSLIHGGADQENGYRAGTPAVHDIVGFGKACEIALRDMKSYKEKILGLEIEFKNIISRHFPDVIFLADEEAKVPGAVSLILPGVNSQLFIRKWADKMAFSSGSACSSSSKTGLLDNIGMPEYRSNFFRITFGKFNSLEELKEIDRYLANS